jgi:hypothetical protein
MEDDDFRPTPVKNGADESLFPSEDSKKAKSYRDARLFLLATSTSTITATATSTSTTYTATLSMTVNCSPLNVSKCG